jgi:hypothetical protein
VDEDQLPINATRPNTGCKRLAPLTLRKRLNLAVGPSSALLASDKFTLLAAARQSDLMAS